MDAHDVSPIVNSAKYDAGNVSDPLQMTRGQLFLLREPNQICCSPSSKNEMLLVERVSAQIAARRDAHLVRLSKGPELCIYAKASKEVLTKTIS
jgi:hypothetical protein